MAKENAALAFRRGVGGENDGSGNKVTVISFENIRNRTESSSYDRPDSTTSEFTSLMNPNCSIAFLTNAFLTSTGSIAPVSSPRDCNKPQHL